MAFDTDPYRTLGLPRDASLDQVKRAYRRLAKANHPDAAGPDALPRFLAIQDAYDRIVDGGPGGGPGTGGAAPRRPWEADPSRAGATHRAYGGRARRQRTPPAGASDASAGGAAAGTSGAGAAGTSGSSTGSRGSGRRRGQGSAPRGATGGPAAGRSTRPPREPNKATLGSTSYDGADAEPFEPDWGGASWYGTTSGTYWTLNPKEYADPRKHGPEYQARARRRREAAEAEVSDGPAATTGPIPDGVGSAPEDGAAEDGVPPSETVPPDARAGASTGPRPAPPPTHTTASWWEATAGTAPPAGDVRRDTRRAPPSTTAGATATIGEGTGLDATLATLRDWLDGAEPGLVARVARAVIGWAPIALGIGWLMGEMSGCARAAATCADELAPIAWMAQAAALVVLLLLPRLATVAAIATAVSLGAAIPGALLLSATGGSDAVTVSRTVLGGVLVIAWAVGIVVAGWREVRRRRPGTDGGAGPVS